MTTKQVWLIMGAGRGLGVDIAKAALAAGHAVVATGRNPNKVKSAIGENADLLELTLDVTRLEDAERAVDEAVKKFGRIDVLINNAGNFYAGFFEELSPQQVRDQIETLLFGPMNVTRAVLPAMRKQRSGLVVSVSSHRRHHRRTVLHRVRCRQVRRRRLDGVADAGNRAVRHSHHARRAGLLSHRTAQSRFDDVRGTRNR